MIPLNVKIRGYRSFDETEVNLKDLGGAVISGENGAGKSTLIEAILWCWFGESRSGSRSHDRVVRIGRQEASVTVEFEAAGEKYKVTRTRSTKGRGKSTLEFYRLDGQDLAGAGAWTPLTGKNATGDEDDGATQAAIQKALGISYDTLVNGPVILQDDADRFTRAKPEERREVLRAILRLDEYKVLAGQARGRATACTTQADLRRRDLDAEGNPEGELEMACDGLAQRRAAQTATDEAVVRFESAAETSKDAAREARTKQDAQAAALARRPALQDALAEAGVVLAGAQGEVRRLEATLAEAAEVRAAADERVPALETQEAAAAQAVSDAGANAEKRKALEARKAELVESYQTTKRRRDAARAEAEGIEAATLLAGMVESRTTILGDVQTDLEKTKTAVTEARRSSTEAIAAQAAVDSHPEVSDAQAQATRAAAQASEKAEAANTANANLLRATSAHTTAAGDLRYRRGDVERIEQEIAALVKRTGLLTAVPCTKSASGWLPHEATTPEALTTRNDLAGTCPLLADARGAAAQVTEKRKALDEARGDVERLEQAKRDAECVENDAQKLRNAAVEHARLTKEESERAARAVSEIRSRIAATLRTASEAAARRLREAETRHEEAQAALTEAQEALAASKNAQTTLESKRAAQARAAEEQTALDGITRQGETVRDEIAALPPASDQTALQRTLDTVRRDLGAAREMAAKIHTVESAEEQIGPARARVTKAEEGEREAQRALDECREDPALALEVTRTAQAAQEAAQALQQARAAATTAAQAVTRAEGEVERLKKAVEARATKRGEVERLAADAASWTQTAQALEIAAVILIERAIPIIEAQANRILQRISSRGMRLTLNTQRANKTTEGVRETLDVIVQDAVGMRPYEDFSGGEKFRINMALRLGLARLLADREGVPVEFLVIDEGGFGALDPDGIGAMKEVVSALQTDFRLILLVTHIPDVADCLPRLLRVRQNGNGSVIEVAA